MLSLDLTGKHILLTGALGAIAEHLVKRLTAAGAIVLATDLMSEEAASATLVRWGVAPDQVIYRRMDVTSEKDVHHVVDELFTQFPACDLVLGHAGGCALHGFEGTSADEFRRIFEFNFISQTYLARAVLAQWTCQKTAGHLIFTSSYVAKVPHVGVSAYAAAKAALENFARCLALEFADRCIRVNCISPGNVAAGSSLKVYQENAAYREFVDRVTPFGGRNSGEGIADTFLFLCSPLAAEWNGQTLHVDRGITLPKIG